MKRHSMKPSQLSHMHHNSHSIHTHYNTSPHKHRNVRCEVHVCSSWLDPVKAHCIHLQNDWHIFNTCSAHTMCSVTLHILNILSTCTCYLHVHSIVKQHIFSFTPCIPTRVLNNYALMSRTACNHCTIIWYRGQPISGSNLPLKWMLLLFKTLLF